jgi:hypothetical protein
MNKLQSLRNAKSEPSYPSTASGSFRLPPSKNTPLATSVYPGYSGLPFQPITVRYEFVAPVFGVGGMPEYSVHSGIDRRNLSGRPQFNINAYPAPGSTTKHPTPESTNSPKPKKRRKGFMKILMAPFDVLSSIFTNLGCPSSEQCLQCTQIVFFMVVTVGAIVSAVVMILPLCVL